jgi:hypothetical protein
MHPVIFIGGATVLGVLFALQEWLDTRFWNYHIKLSLLANAWGVQYFLWGVLCWVMWFTLRDKINSATWRTILFLFVPLSIVVSVTEEIIWVLLFPNLPLSHAPMPFWQRLAFHLDAEFVDNLVLFWSAFCLFRGLGYYQRFREKERMASQLESQLVQSQMRALRMQLNPHFLFNTMNGISSLMRTDVSAADLMLEQLSRLLRITLDRGEAQFIALSDEMEFIEMYLAMQDRRYQGRVDQQIHIDPHLLDAIVPTMILQPIVENAYRHGLSRITVPGVLRIEATSCGEILRLAVTNTGPGLTETPSSGHLSLSFNEANSRRGVGLSNVRERLEMHYGASQSLAISALDSRTVQVTITFPITFSDRLTKTVQEYSETQKMDQLQNASIQSESLTARYGVQ